MGRAGARDTGLVGDVAAQHKESTGREWSMPEAG